MGGQMKIFTTTMIFLMFAVSCSAEEYIFSYTWAKEARVHSTLIEVNGNRAIERTAIEVEYEVLENTKDELMLLKRFTKSETGADYPVGIALLVLDKKTGVFVRSNTFAGGDQNNHAIGTGKMLPQRKK